MNKRLAGFYGLKSFSNNRSSQPKSQEYIVLGVNQPLIAPETEQGSSLETQVSCQTEDNEPGRFRFSLLLSKLL